MTFGDYTEPRNFMEPIWTACESYLLEFVQMMVKENPEDRASIDELFQCEFIRRHENQMLDHWIVGRTLTVDPTHRCRRFFVAFLMQQIVCRHMKGVFKKQLLASTWPAFHEKRKKEREDRMREHAKLRREDKEVPETSDKETIEEEK